MNDSDKRLVSEAKEFVQKKKELIGALDKFLNVPIGDGCDWPVMEHDDFVRLHEIVRAITDLKWKRDCDNDSVVSFSMTNRKTHYQVPFPSIPATDHYEGVHTLGDDEMRALTGLLRWVSGEINQKQRQAEHQEKENK